MYNRRVRLPSVSDYRDSTVLVFVCVPYCYLHHVLITSIFFFRPPVLVSRRCSNLAQTYGNNTPVTTSAHRQIPHEWESAMPHEYGHVLGKSTPWRQTSVQRLPVETRQSNVCKLALSNLCVIDINCRHSHLVVLTDKACFHIGVNIYTQFLLFIILKKAIKVIN